MLPTDACACAQATNHSLVVTHVASSMTIWDMALAHCPGGTAALDLLSIHVSLFLVTGFLPYGRVQQISAYCELNFLNTELYY